MPKYIDGSLEAYFQEVDTAAPPTLGWRVRRQVAFGVFPSARLAMFHDLAPDNHDFAGNEVIANLFGGAGASGATPFADEYEIDKPEIESQVPCLVMDADSSQFSTIVDIAQGKNLSVEGPPGTGKSQTIVNTIAAAITSGKKVLFVAEKPQDIAQVRAADVDVRNCNVDVVQIYDHMPPAVRYKHYIAWMRRTLEWSLRKGKLSSRPFTVLVFPPKGQDPFADG